MITSAKYAINKDSKPSLGRTSAGFLQGRLIPIVIGILTAIISVYLVVMNEFLFIARFFTR